MFSKQSLHVLVIMVLSITQVLADDTAIDSIINNLQRINPELTFKSVSPTQLDDFYEVVLTDGELIYAHKQGQYFFTGDLYANIEGNKLVNITRKSLDTRRQQLLAEVAEEDMWVFNPSDSIKSTITVFTDVDCFYCRKLHQEIEELNSAGIKVRYLAFPRQGPASETYRKTVSSFCATDRNTTLTQLKNGIKIPAKECQNPVMQQYQLGIDMGVTATPTIVLVDGSLIRGYLPADELIAYTENID